MRDPIFRDRMPGEAAAAKTAIPAEHVRRLALDRHRAAAAAGGRV
jgi:hypothetical protein